MTNIGSVKETTTIVDDLNKVLNLESSNHLLTMLRMLCIEHGMTNVSSVSGLGRESLYKALSEDSHPRFETIVKVISALGLKLTVEKD